MRDSLEAKSLGIGLERVDYVCDYVIERHVQFGRATDDVVTVHRASERFVFHLLFHRSNIDVMDAFCRADQRDGDDEAA